MALSNDMTRLLNKIERRLGLTPLMSSLPDYLSKDKWCDVIMQDTLVTFSRYFPYEFPLQITDETSDKKKEDDGIVWYYIKDSVLGSCKLLGMYDILWSDITARNQGLGSNTTYGSYFYPAGMCPMATFESVVGLQMMADFNSLYNRGVYVDFRYPNKFAVKGLANTNYDLSTFVVTLLVEHQSLSTISPTKQEIFESLAICDVANFLYMNLRYYDNLNTAFVEIDLKLQELSGIADKRESVIEEIKNSYVSMSNDNMPAIWTV